MKLSNFEDHLNEKLRDADYAAAYLEDALADGGADEFLYALRDVARANGGVQEIAKKSGHGRESLYKSLSKEGNPRLKTLGDVLQAMGMRLSVVREQGAGYSAEQGEAPGTAAGASPTT